jgi:hypothetical protein
MDHISEFLLDLCALSVVWVAPLVWFVGQGVALAVLRGTRRYLAGVPLLLMPLVLRLTYKEWRTHSNLWPLALIFTSVPAAIWVVACVTGAKPALSANVKWTAGIATVVIVLVGVLRVLLR